MNTPVVQTILGENFEPYIPGRLLQIAEDISNAKGRAYLVGGWVRDALLAKDCRDYDIEVYDISQDVLISILKNYGRTNLVGKAFGVIHLAMKGLSLDFSFPRTESKVGYGHRGFIVHTDEKLSFKEAALRRDFTINAMGMKLPELSLCDPYGGIQDLKKGILRHVGDAFVEDSLRVLRGVQFASRFGLTLAMETVELCKTLSLNDLSKERLFEEFKKWLLKPGMPSLGLKAFVNIGLDSLFCDIVPMAKSWDYLGNLLDSIERFRKNEVMKNNFSEENYSEISFAAILCGNAFLNKDMESVKIKAIHFLNLITNELHLLRRVPELLACYSSLDFVNVPSDSEIRRLSVKLLGLKNLCTLVNATPIELIQNKSFSQDFESRSRSLNVYYEPLEPLLTGKKLIEVGIKPGKQMGEIINECFNKQIEGEFKTQEQALEWVIKKWC